MSEHDTGASPWIMITAYPRWPSPYFAHLERYAPVSLQLGFRASLDDIPVGDPVGVVNLHRLKRLYRDPATGHATPASARGFLSRLAALKEQGWRVAWTVHNLLPIDGPPAGPADREASTGVLALADAVLCHTKADARALKDRTAARIWVTGWSCLDPPSAEAPETGIARLAAEMIQWPLGLLLLGHITPYKNVPATVRDFLASTRIARIAVTGDCLDPGTAHALKRLAKQAGGRVRLHLSKVPPDQAGHLYAAADAAVCPYRTDGQFGFFTDMLHPSSVGTATGFGVPVIAPGLPAVAEITHGQRRWLADPLAEDGLRAAMATAETDLLIQSPGNGTPRRYLSNERSAHQWRHVTAVYQQASSCLAASPAADDQVTTIL